MRKEYWVGLFFTLAALMFGAPAIIHDFFPDLSRPTFLAIDAACIVLTAALTVAGIVAAMWENDPAAQWRRRARGFKRKVILRFAGVVLIVVFIGWFLLPTDPLKNQLPGFSAYAVLNLQNETDFHRKYVFVFGPESASHAEFYLSASGEYTFSVTDLHGEKYPLETNIGDDGIPTKKWIAVFSQVGLTDKTTILRLVVNGKEIIRRTLPFVINIPREASWQPASLGGGNFFLEEIGAYPFSLSNDLIAKLWANIQSVLKI